MSTENLNTAPADDNTIDGAIVEVKPDNALVILDPKRYATELFAPFGAQLTQARRKAARTAFDVTTTEGKVALRAIIRSFVTIRTSSDKAKTEAKRPIDQAGKSILEVVAPIKAACEAEEAKYQQILTAQLQAEEAEKQRKIEAERVRVEQIENRIADIRAVTIRLAQANSDVVAAKLQELVETRLNPEEFDDHLEDALRAVNTATDELRALHSQALDREEAARKAEADRQELIRLKAEQAERERIAAAEQAERDAQSQRDREAAAERDRQFAAQQAAVARQQQQMQEIMDIQALATALQATSDRTRASVLAAVEKARAFEPGEYGTMAAMAKMARDAALPILEDLLAGMPEPINAEGQYYSKTTFRDDGKPILCNADGTRSIFCDVDEGDGTEAPEAAYIDWKESAPLAEQFLTPSPVETPRVDDSKEVAALQQAVRDLYATRTPEEICQLVSDEIDELEAGEGK